MSTPRTGGEGMKPGRELDALVAKKVMGWTTEVGVPRLQYGHADICYRTDDGDLLQVPHFSTRIEDAWEVVEHMAKPNTRWDFELFSANPNVGPAEYFATHVTYTADEPRQEARTDTTMPHAICLAALKAVGHDG